MAKTRFVVGFAAGYVLGARAGKERYEQIKRLAARVQHDPRVQSTVDQAKHQAVDAAAHAKEAAMDKAKDKVADLRHGGEQTPPAGTYARTEPRVQQVDGDRPEGLMT
jgi:hypothetical protein